MEWKGMEWKDRGPSAGSQWWPRTAQEPVPITAATWLYFSQPQPLHWHKMRSSIHPYFGREAESSLSLQKGTLHLLCTLVQQLVYMKAQVDRPLLTMADPTVPQVPKPL